MTRWLPTLLVLFTLGAFLLPPGGQSLQASHRKKKEAPKPPPTTFPRIEVRENRFPDGALRTRWHVRLTADDKVVRQGRLQRYHPNGKLALLAQYRDGRPTGVWRWFDVEGQLLRAAVPQGDYDDVLSGRDLENPNSVYYDPQGRRIAEGLRKYDLPHGEWTYYHGGGAVSARGRFVNGLPDGRWVHYYATGQVERLEEFKLGVPHGEQRRGWPNGQERLLGQMEQGLRVGNWRTWYVNGQLESEGDYREDRRDGDWRFWDLHGELLRHVYYVEGAVRQEMPLPQPRVTGPTIVTDPRALPFRPRIYDESGTEIKLETH